MERKTLFKIAQDDGCCPYCLEQRVPKNVGEDQCIDIASSLPEGKFPIAYEGDYLFVCAKHHIEQTLGIPTHVLNGTEPMGYIKDFHISNGILQATVELPTVEKTKKKRSKKK